MTFEISPRYGKKYLERGIFDHMDIYERTLKNFCGGAGRFRVMRALFKPPAGEFHVRGLAASAGTDPSNTSKLLAGLVDTGLCERIKSNPYPKYRANPRNPLFSEFTALFSRGRSAEKFHAAIQALADDQDSYPRATLDPLMARTFAKKYLWWARPEEAIRDQGRLVAQVMNLGTFEDVRYLEDRLGEDCLADIVKTASPGYFQEKSWNYWHHRLGIARDGAVPPLPQRTFS